VKPVPSPCKSFNKRRAITCYKLVWNPHDKTFKHYELYRVSNQTPGEYYVLPIETLQKQTTRHFSYHKSGAFHWREKDGARVEPRDGEADARAAGLYTQAMAHLSGQLDGYCIARGKNVSDSSINTMIDIMDGYVIPPLKLIGVNQTLKEKKNHSIFMMCSPYQMRSQRIMAEAERKKESKVMPREEYIKFLTAELPHSKPIELEPKFENFIIYRQEVVRSLLVIAREMVAEKIQGKPKCFWTDPRSPAFD